MFPNKPVHLLKYYSTSAWGYCHWMKSKMDKYQYWIVCNIFKKTEIFLKELLILFQIIFVCVHGLFSSFFDFIQMLLVVKEKLRRTYFARWILQNFGVIIIGTCSFQLIRPACWTKSVSNFLKNWLCYFCL